MAIPKDMGHEKSCIISVSLPPKMKELIDKYHLSPSKLLQEKIMEVVYSPEDKHIAESQIKKNNLQEEIFSVLKKLRAFHDIALKPENYDENQKKLKRLIDGFLEKYPMVSKAEVYAYIERGNFFDKIDVEKLVSNEIENPLDIVKEPTSVYMDASKNKIKEINRGNQ